MRTSPEEEPILFHAGTVEHFQCCPPELEGLDKTKFLYRDQNENIS